MYWKFCAIDALGNVVVDGWSTLLWTVAFDCAKTGDMQAAQAVAATKTSRFIESSFVLLTVSIERARAMCPFAPVGLPWHATYRAVRRADCAMLARASLGRALRKQIAASLTSVTRYDVIEYSLQGAMPSARTRAGM
jgi:hypothetical protein